MTTESYGLVLGLFQLLRENAVKGVINLHPAPPWSSRSIQERRRRIVRNASNIADTFELAGHQCPACQKRVFSVDPNCRLRSFLLRMKSNLFAWTDCLGVIDHRDVVFSVDAEWKHVNYRFAWAWKLTELGIPVSLAYLGFISCEEMRKGRQRPIASQEEWEELVRNHSGPLCPNEVWNQDWRVHGQSFIPVTLTSDQPLSRL